MTRRINKVGETSSITAMVDDSGDRACEAITRFARGVNPMVSVSYGNEGNGSMGGNPTANSGNTAAKLPYRIMDAGAFRPPLMKPINLLPLSRLPRNATSVSSSKDFPDYMKKAMCPQSAEKTVGVKNKILKTSIRPTARYQIETPIQENFEVKYVIQNPIKIGADSGIRTRDLTTQNVQNPKKEISMDIMNISTNSSVGTNSRVIDNELYRDMDTDRYMQDPLHSNVDSKMSRDILKFSDNNNVESGRYMQNPLHSNVDSKMSRDILKFSDNNNVESDRYMQDPLHSNVDSKMSRDILKFSDNNNVESGRYMQDVLNSNVRTNLTGDTFRFIDSHELDTGRYLQKTNHSNVMSKVSQNIHVTAIEDIMDINIKVKDNIKIDYTAPISGNTKDEYIHGDIELERSMPVTHGSTNINKNIYHNPSQNDQYQMKLHSRRPVTEIYSNHGSIQNQRQGDTNRGYNLKPTISAGGYEGRGQKPSTARITRIDEGMESRQMEISRKVNESMQGRYKY
jgi:hypothetical protein